MDQDKLTPFDLEALTYLNARKIWPDEARDFTPWLLENAEALASALEIDIEFYESEHSVGRFSLDLLGRDVAHDATLIVENQLGKTDHDHLGKLITYAAGTDAFTVIWLATRFQEEHRQAIDWLNEVSGEETRFFGIELRVAQIGDSRPAAVLDVVAKPNDWQKHVRAVTRNSSLTERAHRYQRFWESYLEVLHDRYPGWTNVRSPGTQGWMRFASPVRGGFIIPSFAAKGRLRHELYIDTGDRQENAAIYGGIEEQKVEIELAYGRSLVWEKMDGKRAFRIAEYTAGGLDDESSWVAHVEWFLDAGERLRRALSAMEQ